MDHYYFDLTILLPEKDLNIREVADSDLTLSISRYFETLTEFINVAPDVLSSLKKFTKTNDEVKDWKIIEAVIDLLKRMGNNTLLPAFYSLSNARGKGDARLAALHAGSISEAFNSFHLRILSAKRSAKANALPKGAPDEQSSLKELIEFLDTEEANRKMMVLAIDDSPDILAAVAAVLSNEYRVFKLPKPEMLENVLAQVNPELILLDYLMPGLNGFELIPIIRGIEEHKDTPIIFLTSEGTVDHLSVAMALGACDFIVKPFQADLLRQKIAKHIIRKKKF